MSGKLTTGMLLALALLTGGCSSVSFDMLSFGKSDKPAATDGAADLMLGLKDDDVECPPVTVRTGASTLTITGKQPDSTDPNALALRYQGSVVRTARECKVNAGTMTMKIGVEGRIIVGPAGGPGAVDVPLRLAVVHEGPQAKAVAAKLIHVPVSVGEGAPYVNFEHVEQDVTFPLPRPIGAIENYVVYVGFDPSQSATAREKPRAKPRAAPKRG